MSQNFNFVSWNCRGGLTFARKARFIRSMILSQKLALLGLVETKRESFDDFSVRLLWPNLDFDYSFVPSVGASGGLLCFWNPKLISPSRIYKANRWISVDFIWGDISIRFILVYASNCARDRASLWRDLLPELLSDFLCIVVGDFNDILDPSERFNCEHFSTSMLAFSSFISESNLVESPLQGRFFTWQNRIARSKIDRCFLSPSAFTAWPNCVLRALPKSFSDHIPIIFTSDLPRNWGPKPFKSINAWWSHKDFSGFVDSSWISIAHRLPNANLVVKLWELRIAIKTWNRDIFGDLNVKLEGVKSDISAIEAKSDFANLEEDDMTRLGSLYSEFEQVSKHLESLWQQKSRLNWNLHGTGIRNIFIL
ncbi:uncharacterized protein LOC126687962 [Mercurialis annua]|uniref:uncharacterized protein LOC126687962 n=1 Tax=Mercurialis annua TaxID=3986 RepID=UPI00215EEDE7|nr:uncharacterized protein LOC126687962 [Mercurialis annua]